MKDWHLIYSRHIHHGIAFAALELSKKRLYAKEAVFNLVEEAHNLYPKFQKVELRGEIRDDYAWAIRGDRIRVYILND